MITNSFGGCTQRGPNTEVSKAAYCVLQFQSWKKPLFNSCTTAQMLRTCPRLVAHSTVCKRLQPSEQGYSVSLTAKFERAQPIQTADSEMFGYNSLNIRQIKRLTYE